MGRVWAERDQSARRTESCTAFKRVSVWPVTEGLYEAEQGPDELEQCSGRSRVSPLVSIN